MKWHNLILQSFEGKKSSFPIHFPFTFPSSAVQLDSTAESGKPRLVHGDRDPYQPKHWSSFRQSRETLFTVYIVGFVNNIKWMRDCMRVANQNMAFSFELFFTMSGIQKKRGAARREMREDIETGRSSHLLQSMLVGVAYKCLQVKQITVTDRSLPQRPLKSLNARKSVWHWQAPAFRPPISQQKLGAKNMSWKISPVSRHLAQLLLVKGHQASVDTFQQLLVLLKAKSFLKRVRSWAHDQILTLRNPDSWTILTLFPFFFAISSNFRRNSVNLGLS